MIQRSNRGPTGNVEANGPMMQAIAKRLVLAEKILTLKSMETSESLEYIVNELEGHMENLKGDYLKQIIASIRQKEQQIRICEKN